MNCVATGSLGFVPNLERFLSALLDSNEASIFQYNYDAPRSLIYHDPIGRATILLSRHGRITLVGARTFAEARRCATAFLGTY